MQRYLIVIEPTTAGFSAYSPDLPGCVATGATQPEVDAPCARRASSISMASGPTDSPSRRRTRPPRASKSLPNQSLQ